MAIEFTTHPTNFNLEKNEADLLRSAIKEQYIKMNGALELGKPSLSIYENLVDYFKEKFNDLGYKISYKDSSGIKHEIHNPGSSFLKNLFYTDKNVTASKRHRKYEIDLCYLFAFHKLRDAYVSENKPVHPNISISITTPLNCKVIISTISIYNKELEVIKKYVETNFQYLVQEDFRDVRYVNMGSLFDFYNSENEKTVIIKLVGKNSFHNELWINEMSSIKKHIPQNFLDNSVVIKLPDICEGDFNLHAPTGRHKVNEFWKAQIDYLDNNVLAKESDKDLLREATYEKAKCQIIISEMSALIDFICTNARSTPFNHFLNHFTVEEFSKLLSCSVPHSIAEKANEVNTERKNIFAGKDKQKKNK